MHEVALALSVINIAKEAGKENQLKYINKIVIRKGKYCGILEDSFLFAFEQLKNRNVNIKADEEDNLLKNAQIEIIYTDAVAECLTCHRQFQLKRFNKRCPFCQSEDLSFACDYEFYVESIEGE